MGQARAQTFVHPDRVELCYNMTQKPTGFIVAPPVYVRVNEGGKQLFRMSGDIGRLLLNSGFSIELRKRTEPRIQGLWGLCGLMPRPIRLPSCLGNGFEM